MHGVDAVRAVGQGVGAQCRTRLVQRCPGRGLDDGGARPAGAAYDIGAYESGALLRICSVPGTAVAVPSSVIDPSTGKPPTRPGYVLVGAVPPGFTLSAGTVEKTVSEGTIYRLNLSQLSGLTITPPADYKGKIKIEAFFVPQ